VPRAAFVAKLFPAQLTVSPFFFASLAPYFFGAEFAEIVVGMEERGLMEECCKISKWYIQDENFADGARYVLQHPKVHIENFGKRLNIEEENLDDVDAAELKEAAAKEWKNVRETLGQALEICCPSRDSLSSNNGEEDWRQNWRFTELYVASERAVRTPAGSTTRYFRIARFAIGSCCVAQRCTFL